MEHLDIHDTSKEFGKYTTKEWPYQAYTEVKLLKHFHNLVSILPKNDLIKKILKYNYQNVSVRV